MYVHRIFLPSVLTKLILEKQKFLENLKSMLMHSARILVMYLIKHLSDLLLLQELQLLTLAEILPPENVSYTGETKTT